MSEQGCQEGGPERRGGMKESLSPSKKKIQQGKLSQGKARDEKEAVLME